MPVSPAVDQLVVNTTAHTRPVPRLGCMPTEAATKTMQILVTPPYCLVSLVQGGSVVCLPLNMLRPSVTTQDLIHISCE